jgi:hypothetical protein
MTQTAEVTEEEVYASFVQSAMTIMDPTGGARNIDYLSHMHKISKYKARKLVHVLRDKGWVELKCFPNLCEDEFYPPYWAYVLTEKGRDTDHYRQESAKHHQILQACFGV